MIRFILFCLWLEQRNRMAFLRRKNAHPGVSAIPIPPGALAGLIFCPGPRECKGEKTSGSFHARIASATYKTKPSRGRS